MWRTRAENAEWFGRPGVNKGEQAAFPQARLVAVAECGTHAMFDAVVGAYTTGENTLARDGDRSARDRGCCCWPIAGSAGSPCGNGQSRPARTCCGGPMSNMKPRHLETLADGSWLAELRPSGNAGRTSEPLPIRVIDYTIDDGRTNDNEYRLFTTILDPTEASAERARGRVRAALGDRGRLRRAQDPPARRPHGAAIEVTRPRAPRDLGAPVLPLRDPHADVGSRRHTPTSTPTGSASSPRSASLAAASPRRAIFPPHDD